MAFDETITERSINPRVMDVPTDNTSAGLVKLAGQALNAGLDAVDDNTKRDYLSGVENIEDQEQAFAEEQAATRGDLGDALSEGDLKRVGLVQSHLDRLRRGEEAGMLTPSAAQLRRTALLREHAAASPWLVPELKAMTSTYGSGRSGGSSGYGGAPETAQEKEWGKIQAEALRYGTTPDVIIERASLEKKIEDGQNRAVASYADAADKINDTTALMTVDLFAQMSAVLKDDPAGLDKTDWQQLISMRKTQLYGGVSDLRRQWTSEGKVMSKAQYDSLRSDIDEQFTMVQGFADAKDKNTYLKNYKENLENSSIIEMHRANPIAQKVAKIYGDSAPKIMNSFIKTLSSLKSGTTFAELEEMRKIPGDTGLQVEYFLSVTRMLQPNASADFIDKMGSGESTGNPLLDKFANTFAKQVVTDPDMAKDPAAAPYRNKAFMQLVDGDKTLKSFIDSKVYAVTFNDPVKVKQIGNAINSNMIATLDDLADFRIEEGEEVVVTGGGRGSSVTRTPTKTPSFQVHYANGQFSAVYPEGKQPLQGRNRKTNKPLNQLNNYAKLIKLYGIEDVDTWANSVLEQINKQEEVTPMSPDVPPASPPVPEIQGETAEFLKKKEGFSANAYQDEGGVWTIGYGSTQGVKPGDTVTEEEATSLLHGDVATAQKAVDDLVDVNLTSEQEAAVVSLVYNVGRDAFAKSKALKALNNGDMETFASEAFSADKGFVKVSSGGKQRVSEGLIARRESERQLGFPTTTASSKRPQGTSTAAPASKPPERLVDGTYLIDGNLVLIKGGVPVPMEGES